MAVLFRNLSGKDRARIISELRDRGILPDPALKNIVTATDRDEFKDAVQQASQSVSNNELQRFFDVLQNLIRNESVEEFVSEDVDVEEFIEEYF